MKRIAIIVVVLAAIGLAPAARAQDHLEAGVFVDYFRLTLPQTNFVGLGGRFAVNLVKHVQVEAEMSYDFNKVFTEDFTNTGTGVITSTQSNIRVLHGLIGPKVQTGGPVKLFATLKGGAVDFRFDPSPVSFTDFTSSVNALRVNNVNGALYPGGGVEAFLGPLGFRAEIGDEIFFNGGAHHNLKISFGPTIRF